MHLFTGLCTAHSNTGCYTIDAMLTDLNINTIIIFRALQLGDLLCSIPAFRALRKNFPKAYIAIAGLPWQKMLVERFPMYFDEFIHFPGYPGLPEQPVKPEATARFLIQMNKRKFDLALQMQGNGSVVNPMIELFGARYTAGYKIEGHYAPDSPYFMPYPQGISEIHRHLELMKHLGLTVDGDDLEFPITEQDGKASTLSSFGLSPNQYICVHAGSRGSYRQWPPEYFAEAAQRCTEKGYKIVLTGTADEMNVVMQVASSMKVEPVIAAGKTDLGSMAVLLKSSGGLISNCTGVSHVASALKVKSVVISMDGEPERWAPLNRELHYMIDWTKNQDKEAVMRIVDEQFASAI